MKDTDLIPELQEWKECNDDSFSIEDWIYYHSTPELLIGFGKLLWPRFLEHKGGIFFEETFKESSYESWFKNLNGDLIAIQKVMNHCHIIDYFPDEGQEKLTNVQVKHIGNLLIEIWGAKLEQQFPQISISVQLLDYDEEDISSASVSFWTNK